MSDAIALTVGARPTPPTVALQSPVNGTIVPTNATVSLSATLSDPAGRVGGITFTDNHQVITNIAAAPYTYAWNGASSGVHRVVADAHDLGSYVLAESAPAFIVVPLLPPAPAAVLTQPSPTGSYTSSTAVPLAVDAYAATSAISQVTYFEGPTLLGARTSPPFTISTYLNPGNHTVRALVQASNGRSVVTTPVVPTSDGPSGSTHAAVATRTP